MVRVNAFPEYTPTTVCARMLQSNCLCTAGLLIASPPYVRHNSRQEHHGSAHMCCCLYDLYGPCRWGVTDEIKGQAKHLSKLNDVRVAVLDLYRGKIGVDAEEASHVSTSHSWRPTGYPLRNFTAWFMGASSWVDELSSGWCSSWGTWTSNRRWMRSQLQPSGCGKRALPR